MESALKLNLMRTPCADAASAQHCDLTRGYFAHLSDADWETSRVDLRNYSTQIARLWMGDGHWVAVPAEGWSLGSDGRLPFDDARARLICPVHLVARLRAMPRPATRDERRSWVMALAGAFGGANAIIIKRNCIHKWDILWLCCGLLGSSGAGLAEGRAFGPGVPEACCGISQ
jgi:hypothetical protein